MGIESFFVTAATIRNPQSRTDRYGNVVDDWSVSPTDTATVGWLQDLVSRRPHAGHGSEDTDGRDTIVSTHQWFCGPDEPISGYSRLLIDGQTFEVDGAPTTARTPSGGPHHLEVQLHLVDDTHEGAFPE